MSMEDETGNLNQNEGEVSFKRASLVGKKGESDFSFLKKRVRVNIVDKEVKEYSLG